MQQLFIYLSGTVRKSHDTDNPSEWTSEHIEYMSNLFQAKNIDIDFLNPCARSDDLSDELSLFGRDMLQVYLSDFILVDAREKRGIGVGYEIAFANFKDIPVVTWCEDNSHYRPNESKVLGQKLYNFTHPFVSQTSKFISENLKDAVDFIINHKRGSEAIISKDDYTLKAIKYYINTQLKGDHEMRKIIEKSDRLKDKINYIISL